MRRTFYIGFLVITLVGGVLIAVPVVVSSTDQALRAVEMLEESIINQRRAYLKAIVDEKFSDIAFIRDQLGPDADHQEVVSAVRTLFRSTVLPDQGYVWINAVLDWSGGDDYAVRLVHPNLPETEGMLLSTATTDIRGNRPYLEELEGIREHGELYFDYYFKELASDRISHKLTYARLYEPFDWIVATGVYLNDVNDLIASETARLRRLRRRQTVSSAGLVLVAMVIVGVIVAGLERHLARMVTAYTGALEAKNSDLQSARAELEDLAAHDPLSGLLNRRAMLGHVAAEVSRAARHGGSNSMILLDIDRFKLINDRFGHTVGDEVIRDIAAVFGETLRREDLACRWGGEEFLLLITDTGHDAASRVAEKIRAACEGRRLEIGTPWPIRYTVSLGVAVYGAEMTFGEVMEQADCNLYRAKQAGRNRVVAGPTVDGCEAELS